MIILHISDFHYSESNLTYGRIISSIIGLLQKESIVPDCILFTGDLVYYGDRNDDYRKAKEVLFDRLSTELGIDSKNIIICQGNHDINRGQIYPTAENSFNTIYNSNDALNRLYNSKDKSFNDTLLPSSNYLNFEKQFYVYSEEDILESLYSVHFRTINDVQYGFVCINSAWLSALDFNGKKDRGNLLFPTDALTEAVLKLKGHSCRKILLVHHPLHFFKEYNATEIEKLVFNNLSI